MADERLELVMEKGKIRTPKEATAKDDIFRLMREKKALFITGKAGSGKSTLLTEYKEYLKTNQPKFKAVFLAPTNLAALNIGGATIHSFFRFDFHKSAKDNAERQLKRYGAYSEKALYCAIDQIVIDEVSMVKADLFDAMDVFLRRARNNGAPFGGAGVVMCGDYFQLPPIEESEVFSFEMQNPQSDVLALAEHMKQSGIEILESVFGGLEMAVMEGQKSCEYSDIWGNAYSLEMNGGRLAVAKRGVEKSGSYVFQSQVYPKLEAHNIWLTDSFRHSDREFLEVLDELRKRNGGKIGEKTLAKLNSRVKPDYKPQDDANSIYLTARNRTADRINREMLSRLAGEETAYAGQIELINSKKEPARLPNEREIALKPGAKVVFITNDREHRWVNGSIGRVSACYPKAITVKMQNGTETVVEYAKWNKMRYKYNTAERKLEEVEEWVFCQLPVKLGWAMTIHKSQGQTFDKVCVDFDIAPWDCGQVYVALSRCRTLEGIVLKQPIRRNYVKVSDAVIDFLEKNDLLDDSSNQKHRLC